MCLFPFFFFTPPRPLPPISHNHALVNMLTTFWDVSRLNVVKKIKISKDGARSLCYNASTDVASLRCGQKVLNKMSKKSHQYLSGPPSRPYRLTHLSTTNRGLKQTSEPVLCPAWSAALVCVCVCAHFHTASGMKTRPAWAGKCGRINGGVQHAGQAEVESNTSFFLFSPSLISLSFSVSLIFVFACCPLCCALERV